jgi:hypothetical protein
MYLKDSPKPVLEVEMAEIMFGAEPTQRGNGPMNVIRIPTGRKRWAPVPTFGFNEHAPTIEQLTAAATPTPASMIGDDKDLDASDVTALCKVISEFLPEGTGFCILTFPFFNPEGTVRFASNAQRAEVLIVLKAWIAAQDGATPPAGSPGEEIARLRQETADDKFLMQGALQLLKEIGAPASSQDVILAAHRARGETPQAETLEDLKFRAGDVVRSVQTGAEYTLATDELDGTVYGLGKPIMSLHAWAVELVRRAAPSERRKMLEESEGRGQEDFLGRIAVAQRIDLDLKEGYPGITGESAEKGGPL